MDDKGFKRPPQKVMLTLLHDSFHRLELTEQLWLHVWTLQNTYKARTTVTKVSCYNQMETVIKNKLKIIIKNYSKPVATKQEQNSKCRNTTPFLEDWNARR